VIYLYNSYEVSSPSAVGSGMNKGLSLGSRSLDCWCSMFFCWVASWFLAMPWNYWTKWVKICI